MIILSLFGGILLLLYGVKLAGDGLQGWAGPRIKTALETMTRNRFAGLFTGVVITFLLQSSSAATVTVVSLIESGLMSFQQSLAVILGSQVGTTITVQLISFKVYDYALFICGVGLLVTYVSNDNQRRHAGQGILGFGLIFLSIKLMSEAMKPMRDVEIFTELLVAVGSNPLIGILVATIFTAIIQSSAATIGIAITLGLEGLIPIESAVPLILGANVGTAATAILSAVRGSAEAKRAAFSNLAVKIAGVFLVYPFLGPLQRSGVYGWLGADVPRQIANIHTVFNIGLAGLMLPLTGPVARLMEGWFPEAAENEEIFRPKYLNQSMLKTPSLALAQATRETMRMAEIVQDMVKLSLPAIINCDLALIERVEAMDDNVDLLDQGIRFYLTQIGKEHLTPEEAARQMETLVVISNLEAIGDVVDKNIMEHARKKAKECVQFSAQGRQDIEDLHDRVLENFELAMSAYTTRDADLAERVYRNKRRVRELEKDYYQRHISRLEKGLTESYETSSIHLDMLTNLKRINTHLTNIVKPVMKFAAYD